MVALTLQPRMAGELQDASEVSVHVLE
jgi:hypothetical protein